MIIRIMTYNIFEGGVGRLDPIAEVIRHGDPHVVVLPETWDDEAFIKLAARLKMEYFQAHAAENPHGHVGLLTRLPLREAVNHAALDHRLRRAVLHAVVDAGGLDLPIIGLHVKAGATAAAEAERMAELPIILEIARRFDGRPHVLAGDFNSSHPEQIIDINAVRPRTREEVRDDVTRFPRAFISGLLAAGYCDAHAKHRAPAQFQATFTTQHPALRYDYILVSPDLRPAVVSCDALQLPLGKYASDHYPVMAVLHTDLITN